MKIKKNLLLPLIILVTAAVVFFCWPENKNLIPYSKFYNEIQNKTIETVYLYPDRIEFLRKNDKTVFTTENPLSPTLKETLLLNNISVSEEKGTEEILTLVFDILFYLIFFGVIIFAFRKFISPNTFKTVHKTGVKFDNIVGMDNLKKDMMQIVKIMKNPAEYKAKGIRLPKGILLEGAPGNGKTLFARAIAGEAKVNFIPAKATDFESMFMAIGPAKVKLLFKKARRKAPCIVFIDEFDGIGTRRNYSGSAIETENTRIVTALLNELDGFVPNNEILVIAATNSRAALDEALIRPGRFDAKYTVPYPDFEDRKALIQMYCGNKKIAADISIDALCKSFNNFSCAQIESIINRAAILTQQDERNEITQKDINGALKEI